MEEVVAPGDVVVVWGSADVVVVSSTDEGEHADSATIAPTARTIRPRGVMTEAPR